MYILNEYLKLDGIEKVRRFIKETGRTKKIKKGDFYFKEGSVCKNGGYIQSGAFRYIGYTSSGKEQIVGYSFENDFVTDYGSLMNNSVTIANAQAIKDSIILEIHHDELIGYFENCGDCDFRSKLAETFLKDVYNRLISLYCHTPEERYIKLVELYPRILELVHLKEIASFIKVTPETLSRIRKKMT